MLANLRIAWRLLRGSDRREWWRAGLTALGALLGTGFALAAVTVAAMSGSHRVPVGGTLLNGEGTRVGVVLALLGLLAPVLGFLGQCARIGAVHRDRRLATLRLIGASPRQVRQISALESGLTCLAGSLLALLGFIGFLLAIGYVPELPAVVGGVLVTLGVPLLAVLVGVFALRRVVASPLGVVRRIKPERRRVPRLVLVAGTALVVAAVDLIVRAGQDPTAVLLPLGVIAAVTLTGAAALAAAGGFAKYMGRRLSSSPRPAVLIAAGRLRLDPWAAARTHASVLLVAVVGVGFAGVWQIVHDGVVREQEMHTDVSYYDTGFAMIGAGVLVALGIGLVALAIGTAESLATRRRTLAAQAAAGVPRSVLRRAVLLETALPLAPAVVLAGVGGFGLYAGYGGMTGEPLPLVLPLLVPFGVYALCLLAAATSLPLLGRAVRPSELRYE
ncbi:ABC transporter permease [Streptomyces sp. NBC_01304]|nr:ABC transporter permease [Streptomyces sp. NBC_01304]